MTTPPTSTPRRGLMGVPPARRSARTPLLRGLVPRILDRIHGGELVLVDHDGTTMRGGDSTGPLHGTLVVNRDDFWRRTARRGHMGFSESYVAGDWDSPDLPQLLELLARTIGKEARGGVLGTIQSIQRRLPTVRRRNTSRRAKQQIGYHYDLGNDFYTTFLDPSMTYSSGLFTHPDMSVEQAQAAKYESICAQLALEPGMRVLEIGCGWGGFATYAARTYGVHVTGVTISEEQHAYARQLVADQGLGDLVDIRLADYRTLAGTFDRIASIEMLEAVGAREYPTFFRTVERLLDPNGLACIQVIGYTEREHERMLRTDGWLRRYIFPGGMCPSVSALTKAMVQAGNLQLAGLTEMGRHYVPTLAAWREAVVANRDAIMDLGYDEAFLRGWEYYLAYCEAGFRAGVARTMQLLVTPSLVDSPLPAPAVAGVPRLAEVNASTEPLAVTPPFMSIAGR